MTYNEIKSFIGWGDTTAFVFDTPSCRHTYTSGIIEDDVFANVTEDTEFSLQPINLYPEVKEVIHDNFLGEMQPAGGRVSREYDLLKDELEMGLASLAIWQEGDTTAYMLVLHDESCNVEEMMALSRIQKTSRSI